MLCFCFSVKKNPEKYNSSYFLLLARILGSLLGSLYVPVVGDKTPRLSNLFSVNILVAICYCFTKPICSCENLMLEWPMENSTWRKLQSIFIFFYGFRSGPLFLALKHCFVLNFIFSQPSNRNATCDMQNMRIVKPNSTSCPSKML